MYDVLQLKFANIVISSHIGLLYFDPILPILVPRTSLNRRLHRSLTIVIRMPDRLKFVICFSRVRVGSMFDDGPNPNP